MRIVHAGNRVDADGAVPVRFPPGQVPVVRARLRRLLEHVRPEVVVTAAAAGADLLVVEQALELGLAVHVVLPFDREEFRAQSVADRGQEWSDRYDRALAAVARRPQECLLVEHDLSAADDPYRRGNQLLLDHARGLAGGELLAVAVRPRDSDGQSVTDDFVDRAAALGVTWLDLDPAARPDHMRRAFVAMPFGTKRRDGRRVDCDATFGTLVVPALEDADLAWERADESADTGLIHVDMLEQLGNADVVVVDTATQNPNVFYELGVRHALADKTTLLLGPVGDIPPFDVAPVRHFPYRLRRGRIAETSALSTLAALRPVLDPVRLAAARRDSPVFEFFDVQRRPLRPRGQTQDGSTAYLDLHRRVSAAATPGNMGQLTDLLVEVDSAVGDADQRRQLTLRIGIALRESGEYDGAVDALTGLDYGPDDAAYPLWAQQYALALRRRGEALVREGGDPEPLWVRAQELLVGALEVAGDDPETCGILGGLHKRRALRAARQSDLRLATAHLVRAAKFYERGFSAEPSDYYTGLNALAVWRLLADQVQDGTHWSAEARRLLPVVAFFTDRALADGGEPFWALVSAAELALVRHLLDGIPTETAVEDAYLKAATARPLHDQAGSVLDQLELYERFGDPPALLARLRARFAPA